jgi:pimeloyl-ACP methyl ester carboxylesterase
MPLPLLVLLPGLDGTGILFKPLIAALPPEVSTVVVAYPGEQPLGYAELLPVVLAALPTEHAFVLLGESFSGPLAVMAAATRPPGLVGLVLCATFVQNPHPYIPGFLNGLCQASLISDPLASLKAPPSAGSSFPFFSVLIESINPVAGRWKRWESRSDFQAAFGRRPFPRPALTPGSPEAAPLARAALLSSSASACSSRPGS